MTSIKLWQSEDNDILPKTAKSPIEISKYAVQLGLKDKRQIVSAFESEHYEMALSYLWGKTIMALKKELSTVGIGLIGEMLGRFDVNEDDDIDDILTTKDSIRLAEELGIITTTNALRLRHTHELINHFSQLSIDETDEDEINQAEAMASFTACVKGVLARPKLEVAKKFVEFRNVLEAEALANDDHRIEMLKSSPYFFHKLTISVLMNAAKKNYGANLEHTLANLNLVVPAIWSKLQDSEKWQIGHAYAEAYSDGRKTALAGIKSVLIKVKGFDFVPENLRSDTFVKAAAKVLKAHEGMNNFYNEAEPVRDLGKLGTVIPIPALPACITALLSVILGNKYGVAWGAIQEANRIMNEITTDRWLYYINNVLSNDARILIKISLYDKPREKWIEYVDDKKFNEYDLKGKNIKSFIEASAQKNDNKVKKIAQNMLEEYYGKSA